MMVLGAAVRLTGSGLSMVDWRPLLGVLPPLNDTGWHIAFDRYRQFPEFRLLNPAMSLAEFKFIFLMEYAHRILGRLIGLVFLVPLAVLSWRKRLAYASLLRLWLVFILGGLQGLIGWYMVKSGLVDVPHVSQYRLVLHFMLAVVIYLLLVRTLLGLAYAGNVAHHRPDRCRVRGLNKQGRLVLGVLLLLLASGAMVAGTKAGFIYNTYPKMGADWLPVMSMRLPWWKHLFENPVLIQFVHRWLALVVLAMLVFYAARVFVLDRRAAARRLAVLLLLVGIAQAGLGVLTLINRVPVLLGVLHQAGAVLLLTVLTAVWCLYLPPIRSWPERRAARIHAQP